MKTTLSVSLWALSTSLNAFATQATFNVTDDVSVASGAVVSSTQLGVGGTGSASTQETFLKFSVSGITEPLTSAKIILWSTNGGVATSSTATRISETHPNWDQTLSWSKRPLAGAVANVGASPAVGSFLEYSVTSAVQANGIYSFLFSPESTDGLDVYSSKAAAADRPQLVVNGVTYYPSEDTYVDSAAPTSSFGSSTLLYTDTGTSTQAFLIKFNVSGVTNVTSAKIRLKVANASTNAPAVYSVGNNWSASSVSWSTQPATEALDSVITVDNSNLTQSAVQFDVTGAIRGSGTYSFRLSQTSSDGITFNSLETGSHVAQLVVTSGTDGGSTGGGTSTTGVVRSLYVNDNSHFIDATKRAALLSWMLAKKYNELAIESYALVSNSPAATAAAVTTFRNNGIRIWFLRNAGASNGATVAASYDSRMAPWLTKVAAYQATYCATGNETSCAEGVILDIEPHTFPGWSNSSPGCMDNEYIYKLGQAKAAIAGRRLKLSVDIPRWFDTSVVISTAACGGYPAITGPNLVHAIFTVADRIDIMNYVNTSSSQISDTAGEVAIATAKGKTVVSLSDGMNESPASITYYSKGFAAMTAAQNAQDTAYLGVAGYGGTGFFDYAYRPGSSGGMAP